MATRSEAELDDLRLDWLPRAVVSGFAATGLMTLVLALAYGAAAVLGSASPQAPTLLHWLWALAYNPVTERVQTSVPLAVLLHFIAGIGWAIVYASAVEPRIDGQGWRKGVLFALVPWVLSLVVFLPIVGGGLFGLGVGAGPLPILGNLLLHLVYGVTLGQVYPLQSDRPLTETGEPDSAEEPRILAGVNRSMAIGIVVGFALGALVGGIGSIAFAASNQALATIMVGALSGSAVGALLGSFSALTPASHRE